MRPPPEEIQMDEALNIRSTFSMILRSAACPMETTSVRAASPTSTPSIMKKLRSL